MKNDYGQLILILKIVKGVPKIIGDNGFKF